MVLYHKEVIKPHPSSEAIYITYDVASTCGILMKVDEEKPMETTLDKKEMP